VKSGKEAKRLVAERGLRFNNELVLEPNAAVTAATIGRELKVSVGRKKHYLVRLED
jgi:tyrosyl-tRNA synthetase